MERFLMQYQDRIVGSIAGFDRVLFRGDLRAISYPEGLGKYLSSQGILYKEFGDYAEAMSEKIKAHGEAIALQAGRPFIYRGYLWFQLKRLGA